MAVIQLGARRSLTPQVVSPILTCHMFGSCPGRNLSGAIHQSVVGVRIISETHFEQRPSWLAEVLAWASQQLVQHRR